MLTNIVLNAAQQIDRLPQSFTRNGAICVAASVERDSLGVSWLVLRIHDNGPGIHGGDFERVFELHYTTKEQGCGMGLDICRKIAASVAYGTFTGTVRVQRSILLASSTFEVRLPILQKGVN
jgi:signal transduction histidine kinase